MNSNKRPKGNKRTRKYRKRTRNTHKIYKYVIKTPIITYTTPEYTSKNLHFNLYDILNTNEVFQMLRKEYSQFKLQKVTFFSIPRSIGGTDPSPCWIYLDTNGDSQVFNYTHMPELQGSKRLPVKHLGITSYSSTGRQNDFKYWYDITTMDLESKDLSIRLTSEAEPNSSKFWQFQIGYVVYFRGLIVPYPQNKVSQDQKIKIITESQKKEGEVKAEGLEALGASPEQQEGEEDDWEHQDSDWDES